MAKAYTVVLVATPAGYLVINRRKPPYIGLWNGLGGKIEPGETPVAGAIREVQEESGVRLAEVQDCGLVHWYVDGKLRGDLYLFSGTAATEGDWPQATREGILAAMPDAWLTDPANLGLVPDLAAMLPLFNAKKSGEYASHFTGEQFIDLVTVHD